MNPIKTPAEPGVVALWPGWKEQPSGKPVALSEGRYPSLGIIHCWFREPSRCVKKKNADDPSVLARLWGDCSGNGPATARSPSAISYKIQHTDASQPGLSTSRYLCKRNESRCPQKDVYSDVYSSSFHNICIKTKP